MKMWDSQKPGRQHLRESSLKLRKVMLEPEPASGKKDIFCQCAYFLAPVRPLDRQLMFAEQSIWPE
jgi:hypothetical protein